MDRQRGRVRHFGMILAVVWALTLPTSTALAQVLERGFDPEHASSAERAFATGTLVGTENGPRAVEVVDWDQDGRLDVIVASYDGNRLRRFMNTESGWLSLSLGTFVDGPSALASGDLDGDGTADLAYTGADVNTLRIILNRSSNFLITVDNALDHGLGVAIADIDGDGDFDLVASSFGAGQLYWYNNLNGDGESWNRQLVGTPGGGPRTVVPADIDGDGDLDLVVVTFSRVLWYENRLNVGGAWLEHVVDSSFPAGWSVAVGDLDGDGRADIVAGSVNTPVLAWWKNPGPPASGAWSRTDIAMVGVADIRLVDLDQDGDLDIAITRWGTGANAGLRWYENRDSASEWEGFAIAGGYDTPRALAIADLDRDGDLDIVLAGGESDVIDQFENLTIHRGVRFDQPSILIGNPRSSELAPEGSSPIVASRVGDFNGDGNSDILTYEQNHRLYWRDDLNSVPFQLQALAQPLTDPRAFVVGDVDGDGDLDVVLATVLGVEWLENLGVPGVWGRHTISTKESIVALWLADINGDGRLDVVGVDDNAKQVRWWRQGASNTWFDNFVDSYTTFRDLAIGDVDLDGKLEVVVARESTIVVRDRIADSVWDQSTVGSAFTSAIALADLDGDGDLDVVVSNPISPGNSPLRAFRNNRGSWSPTIITTATVPLTSLVAVDIDDDGDMDLVGGTANGTTTLALNPGDGSLTFVIEQIQLDARLVEVVDLNRDGKLDLFGHRGSNGPRAKLEVGGQFSVGIAATAPPTIPAGQLRVFARLDLLHLGRPGDEALELNGVSVVITDEFGNVLTGQQGLAIFSNLSLWRDYGDDELDGEDAILSLLDPMPFVGGEVTFEVDPINSIEIFDAPSTGSGPEPYRLFVAGTLTDTAHQFGNLQFWMSPIYEETTATDPSGTPLRLHLPPHTAQLVYVIPNDVIFADGFDLLPRN